MKRTYKLRNWSEYTTALVKRGSLTLWGAGKRILCEAGY